MKFLLPLLLFCLQLAAQDNKATISRSDSLISMHAVMRLDHRFFGYEKPDIDSRKLIAFSIFTDDVQGNPHKCLFGAYYDTSGMKMDLKYLSDYGPFREVALLDNGLEIAIVYFEKEWVEWEEDELPYTLTQENAGAIRAVYFAGNDQAYTNNDTLANYLKVELIDRSLYESKIATAVDFLVMDQAFKKTDSLLTLTFKSSSATFTDHVVDDETYASYSYVGQVPALNQYVIHSVYYEDEDLRFFDRDTGKETAFFMGDPFLSPDKKSIISVFPNIYESTTDLSLDRVTENGISPALFVQFKNWLPATDDDGMYYGMFYSDDGYFYLPAIQVADTQEFYNDTFGPVYYIRIKVL